MRPPLPSAVALLLTVTALASHAAGNNNAETITVVEGASAKISCTGQKNLSLIWIPDNAECLNHLNVMAESRWEKTNDKDQCWLTIRNMKTSDSGKILFKEAEWTAVTATLTRTSGLENGWMDGYKEVNVLIKPACEALHIQSTFASPNETDAVILTCRHGNTAPRGHDGYVWTFQGKPAGGTGSTVNARVKEQGLWSCTYGGQTAEFCLVKSGISQIKELECKDAGLTDTTQSLTPHPSQGSSQLARPVTEVILIAAGCLLIVIAIFASVVYYRERKKALISPYITEPFDGLRQSRLTCHPELTYDNATCGLSMEMPYVPMGKHNTGGGAEADQQLDYENVSDTLDLQVEAIQESFIHQQNPVYLQNDALYGDVA